jgi:hypothetical protein
MRLNALEWTHVGSAGLQYCNCGLFAFENTGLALKMMLKPPINKALS